MKEIVFILSILFALNAFAQKEFKVMDWKPENTLNTYLVAKMQQQYAERSKLFANALQSKTSLLAYAANVRRKTRELIGALPPAAVLNAKITGTVKAQNCTIEKILYQSFANHHVTANLYIPGGAKQKRPAVVLFCGHEDVSKATDSYQRTALLLAQNGFVVLVIDPISQSERYQLTDANGKPLTRGGTTEHTLINETANLVGSSAVAYELFDNIRGLDYLITRPEVDTSKIGCIGNSGGAIQAIYFAAYDPRVKVIVPCSYLATRERTLELSGPADGCAQMPGEGSALLEMNDYLIAAAPKPILVLAGRYDFIDYSGTVTAFNELKKVYAVLGQPNNVKLFTYDDGHGISKPKREAAVAWFKLWLMNNKDPVHEPSMTTQAADALNVTGRQVSQEYPDETTVFDQNKIVAGSFKRGKATAKEILNFLQIKITSPTVENISTAKKILRAPGEVPIALIETIPPNANKLIIWFHAGGKQLVTDTLQPNAILLRCDVRGIGEMEDKPEFNDPKYCNKEYRNAMLALHCGQSLVAQRTNDILTVLQYAHQFKLPVEIHATGPLALSALHAALADSNIASLHLYNCITSFYDILNNPAEKNWYSWVIPGVLKLYDIPGLIKLVGESKVEFVK